MLHYKTALFRCVSVVPNELKLNLKGLISKCKMSTFIITASKFHHPSIFAALLCALPQREKALNSFFFFFNPHDSFKVKYTTDPSTAEQNFPFAQRDILLAYWEDAFKEHYQIVNHYYNLPPSVLKKDSRADITHCIYKLRGTYIFPESDTLKVFSFYTYWVTQFRFIVDFVL